MSNDKSPELMLETIKDDFKQKQSDLSEINLRVSQLIAVDSIILGLISAYLKFSAFKGSFLEAIAIILLFASIIYGIYSVFPRGVASEVKIEDVIDYYEKGPNYEDFVAALGHYISGIIPNIRYLVNKRMTAIQIGWALTAISLYLMTILIVFQIVLS